jgi:hypothetical protein
VPPKPSALVDTRASFIARLDWQSRALFRTTDFVQTIVVEVSGGVLQQVYVETADIRVILIDWDAGERPGDAFTGGEIPVESLLTMPRDTRIAFSHLNLAPAQS